MRKLVGVLSLTLAIVACQRSGSTSHSVPDASASTAQSPSVPAVTRLPSPRRLVAIGDLHGDMQAALRVLHLSGATDPNGKWTGGDLVVVQVGDQIDRGNDDRAVLDLFDRLATDARATAGQVISLLGNHEVMNVELQFEYVAPGAYQSFEGLGSDLSDTRLMRFPTAQRARAAAFLPGGTYARLLAKRPVAVILGDSVFVHGGLLPKHVRYGLDRASQESTTWMNGDSKAMPAILRGEAAPTWVRRYSAAADNTDCAVLHETLTLLQVKRMVMGHTVQRAGISSACEERAWRVDVGLSAAYQGRLEALVIEGDRVSVLRETEPGKNGALDNSKR